MVPLPDRKSVSRCFLENLSTAPGLEKAFFLIQFVMPLGIPLRLCHEAAKFKWPTHIIAL
jgi:hypothetical protein